MVYVGLSQLLFPMVPMQDVLQQKIFAHNWRFQEWVGGLNLKCHFDILREKLGMDITP